MEIAEAQEYDVAVGQVALSGLSVEYAVETIDGIADGTVNALDVPTDVKASLASAEAKIEAASTKSAQAELGADTFAWLQNAAATHPGVDKAIRTYAIDRATGRAGGISWADLAADIRAQLGA